MTQTTNYELNLVEGTDKVNPLTQMNPNFEKIDEEMKKNADSGITVATELLTGSIHGLLRQNAECAMLRFTATSNYTAGDTFTVDGIQVTALTPTGEALSTGAYIIGSEVLGCLKGTLLTLFVSGGTVTTADNALKLGGEEPSYYATAEAVEQAQSTATAAGVLANSVQTQLTDRLSAGTGTSFYFDEKDGVAGWNSSPTRGADTFHPFSDKTLLWENTDIEFGGTTARSWAGKTIEIDKSGYSHLQIDYVRVSTGISVVKSVVVPTIVGQDGLGYMSAFFTPGGTPTYRQAFQESVNTVRFSNGAVEGSGVSNQYCIPTKIWGIK